MKNQYIVLWDIESTKDATKATKLKENFIKVLRSLHTESPIGLGLKNVNALIVHSDLATSDEVTQEIKKGIRQAAHQSEQKYQSDLERLGHLENSDHFILDPMTMEDLKALAFVVLSLGEEVESTIS